MSSRIVSRVVVAVAVALVLAALRAAAGHAATYTAACPPADAACAALAERLEAVVVELELANEALAAEPPPSEPISGTVELGGDSYTALEDTRHLLGWLLGVAFAGFFAVAFWRTFGRSSGA